MTKSVSNIQKRVVGSEKEVRADVDITSYSANGEPINPGDVGLKRIDHLEGQATESNFLARWDGSTSSPKLVVAEAGADGAELDEVSGDVGTFVVVARGPA